MREMELDDLRRSAPPGITVDIYDQVYHLRGHDPEYIQQLAAMVDAKMRAVASQGTTVDSLRVAVLAALNIADELTSLQAQHRRLTGNLQEAQSTVRKRTSSLSGLLDSLLDAPIEQESVTAGSRRTG